MTLFTKEESTTKELGVDEEAGASFLNFILLSCSIFLEVRLAEAFLGGILRFERILARGLLRFGDFWKDFRKFLEGRKRGELSKMGLEECRHDGFAWS